MGQYNNKQYNNKQCYYLLLGYSMHYFIGVALPSSLQAVARHTEQYKIKQNQA